MYRKKSGDRSRLPNCPDRTGPFWCWVSTSVLHQFQCSTVAGTATYTTSLHTAPSIQSFSPTHSRVLFSHFSPFTVPSQWITKSPVRTTGGRNGWILSVHRSNVCVCVCLCVCVWRMAGWHTVLFTPLVCFFRSFICS